MMRHYGINQKVTQLVVTGFVLASLYQGSILHNASELSHSDDTMAGRYTMVGQDVSSDTPMPDEDDFGYRKP